MADRSSARIVEARKPPEDPAVADVLPSLQAALAERYLIRGELGSGGMATVYLAHDLRHDRPVALIVLRRELAAVLGPERFEREIRLAARLRHSNILTVYDSGDAAGQLWFTMPFVDGESLRDRLTREQQLLVDARRTCAPRPSPATPIRRRPGRFSATC